MGQRGRTPWRRHGVERGAALVEFALILPVFMILVLGTFTGAIAYNQKLDLAHAARLALLEGGARVIEDTGACTACRRDLYYSHRRDHGLTGRQWGVIALRPQRTAREGERAV